MNYRLMVWSLRLAAWLARRWGEGNARGILADAEGDSGYGQVRRPVIKWYDYHDDAPVA